TQGAGVASDFPSMTMTTEPTALPDPRGQVQQGFQGEGFQGVWHWHSSSADLGGLVGPLRGRRVR
ncbi:MAG: hypothetical protein R6U98_09135, partial [Pirellulaceae bacterium]